MIMSNYLKFIFFSLLVLMVGIYSCKEKIKAPAKKEVPAKIVSKKVAPKPKLKPKPAPKKKVEPRPKSIPNKYFLIAASFRDKKNAEQMQKKLTREGFVSEVHFASNGFYRVSYKGFSNRKLAFRELYEVRLTDAEKGTWLYIKR